MNLKPAQLFSHQPALFVSKTFILLLSLSEEKQRQEGREEPERQHLPRWRRWAVACVCLLVSSSDCSQPLYVLSLPVFMSAKFHENLSEGQMLFVLSCSSFTVKKEKKFSLWWKKHFIDFPPLVAFIVKCWKVLIVLICNIALFLEQKHLVNATLTCHRLLSCINSYVIYISSSYETPCSFILNVSPDEHRSNVLSLLALCLVSSWGKYLLFSC